MAKRTKAARKTKSGKAGKSAKSAAKEILVVGSKMKEVVKAAGCMSSSDLIEALSAKVHEILANAAVRARDNNRATIRPHDL